MKRRGSRLAIVLVSMLASSLVAGTSIASYRASVGPRRCCTSHCGHAMPKRAAEQCCQLHAAPGPAATGSTLHQDTAAPLVTLVTPIRVAALARALPSHRTRRGPPDGTLVARYTSLIL